jgi:hypothetical protein
MSAAVGYQTLRQLLSARLRLRVKSALDRMVSKTTRGVFAAINAPPQFAVPTTIALLTQTR